VTVLVIDLDLQGNPAEDYGSTDSGMDSVVTTVVHAAQLLGLFGAALG